MIRMAFVFLIWKWETKKDNQEMYLQFSGSHLEEGSYGQICQILCLGKLTNWEKWNMHTYM
jgi:hypothetical protein